MSDTDIATVRGDFIGSDQCRAEGHTVRGSSPVLALCRKLVEAGFDTNLFSVRISRRHALPNGTLNR